jgi:hypothetical protein
MAWGASMLVVVFGVPISNAIRNKVYEKTDAAAGHARPPPIRELALIYLFLRRS